MDFVTINYDGTFEETRGCAAIAATPAIQAGMMAALRKVNGRLSLAEAVTAALNAWGIRIPRATPHRVGPRGTEGQHPIALRFSPDAQAIEAHLRESLAEKTSNAQC